jgi:hypothetical protein
VVGIARPGAGELSPGRRPRAGIGRDVRAGEVGAVAGGVLLEELDVGADADREVGEGSAQQGSIGVRDACEVVEGRVQAGEVAGFVDRLGEGAVAPDTFDVAFTDVQGDEVVDREPEPGRLSSAG